MSTQKRLKIAFINPPHADWSLTNNLTYMLCQSHYNHNGKYHDRVDWLPTPYKWNVYSSYEEVYHEVKDADMIMFSSYVWNYPICDGVAAMIKKRHPEKITILGGPHIGTNEPDFLASRPYYDYVCTPTRPGETFMQDMIDQWFEREEINPAEISWELRSKAGKSVPMNIDYSVYEEHSDTFKEMVDYARNHKIEPFVVLETTRGCPYKCVYCEWGGGIGTKILKKPMQIVERDILALKKAGFRDGYLTDANFGAFEERDLQIFKFAWDHGFNLTDISSFKAKDLSRRTKLINQIFEIVGKGPEKHSVAEGGTDMWGSTEYISVIPGISFQSVSEEAMKIAERVDLSFKDKIELSRHINQRCMQEGYPVPALELILGMPGSTKEDFYAEMELIWNFRAWSSFRHDYMFLPDSHLNSEEYKTKYNIETVEVFSDIVDEDGFDNWNSLYRDKKTCFKTIRSCYSFTPEDMHEMWFMNAAANHLLQNIYPQLEQYVTPSDFGKISYSVINKIEGFDEIYNEIVDIFNPQTDPRSIRKLCDRFKIEVIKEFLQKNDLIIRSEVSRICLEIAG